MKTYRWVVAISMTAVGAMGGIGPFGSTAQAQDLGQPRMAFEVRAGYEHPIRSLGRTDLLHNESTGWGYARFEDVDAVPFVGAGLTTRIAGGLSLRLNVDRAFESTVAGQWFCDAFSPCPAVLQAFEGSVDRWSAGGDLLMELPQLGLPVTPHVYLGVVRATYAVRWSAPIPEVPIPTAYDTHTWFLRPGFGLSRAVGRFQLFGEAEALVGSSFQEESVILFEGTVPVDTGLEPESQVNLMFSVGARFGLW